MPHCHTCYVDVLGRAFFQGLLDAQGDALEGLNTAREGRARVSIGFKERHVLATFWMMCGRRGATAGLGEHVYSACEMCIDIQVLRR